MIINTDFFGYKFLLLNGVAIYPHGVREFKLCNNTLKIGLNISGKLQHLSFFGEDAIRAYQFLSNHQHSKNREIKCSERANPSLNCKQALLFEC